MLSNNWRVFGRWNLLPEIGVAKAACEYNLVFLQNSNRHARDLQIDTQSFEFLVKCLYRIRRWVPSGLNTAHQQKNAHRHEIGRFCFTSFSSTPKQSEDSVGDFQAALLNLRIRCMLHQAIKPIRIFQLVTKGQVADAIMPIGFLQGVQVG